MADFTVGHKVRAKQSIYEPADDHAPGGYLCSKGDTLVIRKTSDAKIYPFAVSHEDRTDGCTFGVTADEIEPLPSPAPQA